jgi:hypothetical protein
MMKKGIKIIEVEQYGKKKQILHTEFHHNQKAAAALEMVVKWGLSAAKEDGETSNGHVKIKTYTPAEIVDRACECADRAFREFEKRGWLLELPDSMAE